MTAGLASAGFLTLLAFVVGWPWLKAQRRVPVATERVSVNLEQDALPVLRSAAYSRILVPLDHSESDQEAINNALALARMHDAKIILLHVEEGVTSQMFGSDSLPRRKSRKDKPTWQSLRRLCASKAWA